MTAHSIGIDVKDGLSRWRCSCGRAGEWQSTTLAARRGGTVHVRLSEQPALAPSTDGHTTTLEWLYERTRWTCSCGDVGAWKPRRDQAQQGATNHRRLAGRMGNREAKAGA